MDVVAAPTACARDTTAGLDPALAAARGRRSPPPPALPPPSCSRLTLRCPHAWSSPLRPPGARPYTGGRPARRSSPLRPCACRRLPAQEPLNPAGVHSRRRPPAPRATASRAGALARRLPTTTHLSFLPHSRQPLVPPGLAPIHQNFGDGVAPHMTGIFPGGTSSPPVASQPNSTSPRSIPSRTTWSLQPNATLVCMVVNR
jgi:hypothetical protein